MNRKDSWTMEDDNLLAKVVLANVRDGKTQLEAFQEAAERLGRTPQACGFRWNTTVRKQYLDQFLEAKQQGKELRPKEKESKKTKVTTISNLNDPFNNLSKAVEQAAQAYNQLQKDYARLQRQYVTLQKKIEDTLVQVNKMNKESSA